jgi:glutamate-ammonia-ligase adenylyltransferase
VSLGAFERYHQENAWTWERLALTRARVVAGPRWLARRVTKAIDIAVRSAVPDQVAPDTAAMRRRLATEAPPQGLWDIKNRAGGLRDVEFIAQSLVLRHANTVRPAQSTRMQLANLAAAGILSHADAENLIAADRVWRAVLGHLRIAYGRGLPPDALPQHNLNRLGALLDRLAVPWFVDVETRLAGVAAEVRPVFGRYVGEV